MTALQLTADEYIALRIDAVNLKHRLCDIEADCRNRLHRLAPPNRGDLNSPTSMALMRRWRSRPQHQKRTPPHPLLMSQECHKRPSEPFARNVRSPSLSRDSLPLKIGAPLRQQSDRADL